MEEEYERLKEAVDGFCGCAICRDDVRVYALNRLPPHYVTHPHGEVISTFDINRYQEKARVDVVVLEGLRRVGAEPSANCESRTAG